MEQPVIVGSKTDRNLDIDILRGLSIFWVVALHAAILGVPDLSWFGPVLQNGYYGVTIFFVVSGYLITSTSLVRYGALAGISAKAFYSMRVARILPCLLLLIAVLLVLHFLDTPGFVFETDRNPFEPALYALIFRYNVYYWRFSATADMPWRQLWSLGIEEWFYLAFPIVCLVLRRRALIVIAAAALIVYSPHARLNQTLLFYWSGCADALALGCLIALFIKDAPRLSPWLGDFVKFLGLSIIATCCFYGPVTDNFHYGPSIAAGGAALFIFGAHSEPRGKILNLLMAPIRRFGALSYEIYLFHVTTMVLVLPTLQRIVGASSHLILPCIILSIFIVGDLIARLFAEPIGRRIRNVLISKPALKVSEAVAS